MVDFIVEAQRVASHCLRDTWTRAVFDSFVMLAGTGPEPPDNSAQVCRQLMQPPLLMLPDVRQLKSVLLSDLTAKLPIDPDVFATLPPDLSCHFQPGSGRLSRTITAAVEEKPMQGGKPCTTIAVHNTVIALLIKLDRVLRAAYRTGLVIQRDQTDSDQLMTLELATGGSLRSDGQLRNRDGGLLAKWEERGAGLMEAKQDLKAKTAAWSPLYYGDLSYLVCFVAAGAELQFCAIERGTSNLVEIGGVFDLTLPEDRAELTLAAVNLYRILAATKASLPYYVLPAGRDLVLNHPQSYQRNLYMLNSSHTVHRQPVVQYACCLEHTRCIQGSLHLLMAALHFACIAHKHACPFPKHVQ